MITAFEQLCAAIYIRFKQGQAASDVPSGVQAHQACSTLQPQLRPRSRTLLEKVIGRIYAHFFWNKKDDLPRSQEAANCHHPKPDDSSQRHLILVLDAFAELRKRTITFGMSVRPQRTRLPLGGFSHNLVSEYFYKKCLENLSSI